MTARNALVNRTRSPPRESVRAARQRKPLAQRVGLPGALAVHPRRHPLASRDRSAELGRGGAAHHVGNGANHRGAMRPTGGALETLREAQRAAAHSSAERNGSRPNAAHARR